MLPCVAILISQKKEIKWQTFSNFFALMNVFISVVYVTTSGLIPYEKRTGNHRSAKKAKHHKLETRFEKKKHFHLISR